MPNTNNDAYQLPEDMQEQRRKNTDLYLESRKNGDEELKRAVLDAITESDSYKDISARRKELGQEKSADKKRYNELLTEEEKIQAEKAKLQDKLKIKNVENPPETAQSKKRKDMLSHAQEKDTSHAERIEGWLGKVDQLRSKGAISESKDGVMLEGIGRLASTFKHNEIIEEKFSGKVKRPFDWTDHSGNTSQVNTVRKDDLDNYLSENDGKLESGNFRLENQEFVKGQIFSWINSNFEGVKNDKDRLYLLQLINPDMFTRLWFGGKSSSGQSRQAVRLARSVITREFNEPSNDNPRCGLFLVGNA